MRVQPLSFRGSDGRKNLYQLVLRERGEVAFIEPSSLILPGLSSALTELASTGILLKKIDAFANGALVAGSNFVGEYSGPGFKICVSPKAPRLFAALQRRLSGVTASRLPRGVEIHVAESGAAESPSVMFPALLSAAISEGLPFSYHQQERELDRPKGRLLMRQMMRMHAEGRTFRAACSVAERRIDADLLGVLSAAVGITNAALSHRPDLLLSLSIASSALQLPEMAGVMEAIAIAGQLLTTVDEGRPALKALLLNATAILQGQSMWVTTAIDERRRFSFYNVERMWEVGLLLLAAEALKRSSLEGLSWKLHPFQGSGTKLVYPGGPEIDPDCVAFADGKPFIVLDAKYSVKSVPDAADVYQLHAYVDRLSAPIGVLGYLSANGPWTTILGKTDRGNCLIAIGVGEEEMLGHGSSAFQILGGIAHSGRCCT
jgi:hypothetical protein